LVDGLVVVPTIVEEADARCEGTKKNGDICKDKKPKNIPKEGILELDKIKYITVIQRKF